MPIQLNVGTEDLLLSKFSATEYINSLKSKFKSNLSLTDLTKLSDSIDPTIATNIISNPTFKYAESGVMDFWAFMSYTKEPFPIREGVPLYVSLLEARPSEIFDLLDKVQTQYKYMTLSPEDKQRVTKTVWSKQWRPRTPI